MTSGRGLLACVVIAGVLLLTASPTFAAEFVPENGKVTGVGGEVKLFGNQITCAKTKMTGKITKFAGISKIEGPTEFEGCMFGAKKVTNFEVAILGLNLAKPGLPANETVSFGKTEIKVEGGCVVTLLEEGVNLLLKRASFVNVPKNMVLATINVPGNEEGGITYETNKNKECGALAAREKTKTAYSGAEVISGAEVK